MRFGELAGLTRDRLDLDRCEVRITESLVQPDKGGLLVEPPKSRAGKCGLSFPAELAPEPREHLNRYAERGRHGLVFVGPKGGKLRRSNFNLIWSKAAASAGVPGAHFHDGRFYAVTSSSAKPCSRRRM